MSIKTVEVKVCDHCGEQLDQKDKYLSIDAIMYDDSMVTLTNVELFGEKETDLANLGVNMDFCGPGCFVHWIEEKIKDW